MALSRPIKSRLRPRIAHIQTTYIDCVVSTRSPSTPRKNPLRSARPGSHVKPQGLDLSGRDGLRQDERGNAVKPGGCTCVTGAENLATSTKVMERATDCGSAPDNWDSDKSRGESHYRSSFGTLPDCRKSAPAAARSLHFQRFRQGLRRCGPRQFGNIGPAGVFVMPMDLGRQPVVISEKGQPEASLAILESGRLLLPIRVVIRSKDRLPVGLKREFDLFELRATVPEALPSPGSSNIDVGALLAAVTAEGGASLPPSPASARGSRRACVGISTLESSHSMWSENKHCAGPRRPVPMHLPYARAFLPALAAIMMSEQVRAGDRIDLPIPHPRVWAETAAYVYTGEDALLTEQVKLNILYLGGKV